MVLFEVCANSYASALSAELGGADRIELCQNLEQGGITPSHGLIKRCKDQLHIPIHVLIRPRPGDFVYDYDEFQIMLNDVQVCKELGCAGVAIGILTRDGRVDMERCMEIMEAAKGMQVTFHRAFDDCFNQVDYALEDVIRLGCSRILTSGGKQTAYEGMERLAELCEQAVGRITIMAASGINSGNVLEIINRTGVHEVHASASMKQQPSKVNSLFTADLQRTSKRKVEDIVQKLKTIQN